MGVHRVWRFMAETEARQMIPSVLDIILGEAEDVSKARTQQEPSSTFTKPMGVGHLAAGADSSRRKGSIRAVSYTHLTLPTNREV